MSKGYLCLDLLTHKLYTCRHVLLNEAKFPFTSAIPSVSIPNPPVSETWLSNLLYLHSSNHPSILGPYSNHSSPSQSSFHQSVSSDPISSLPLSPPAPIHASASPSSSIPTSSLDPSSHPTVSPPHASSSTDMVHINASSTDMVPVNAHPMTTRSKNGISKPKLCYKAVLGYSYTEPPSYKIASKFSQWVKAIAEEFSALQRQQTWSLVPAAPGINLVGCKWVYKLKLHSDGSIACYKAWLVQKDFTNRLV